MVSSQILISLMATSLFGKYQGIAKLGRLALTGKSAKNFPFMNSVVVAFPGSLMRVR